MSNKRNEAGEKKLAEQPSELEKAFGKGSSPNIFDGEKLAYYKTRYEQLIGAVQRKFPGESRHETALRYIRESERSTNYSQRDIEGQEDIDEG